MVILDIKMLSGFVPDPESLNMVSDSSNFKCSCSCCHGNPADVSSQLKGALLVDRVEQKEDHVLVYIREVRGI